MKRTIIFFISLFAFFSLKAQDIVKVSLVQQDPRLQINMSYDRTTKLNRPNLPGDHLRYQVQKVYLTITNRTSDILNVNITFYAERYCGQSDYMSVSAPNGGDGLQPGASITKSWSADRSALGSSNCKPKDIGNGQYSYIESVRYDINDIFNVSEERRKRAQPAVAPQAIAGKPGNAPKTGSTAAANTPATASNTPATTANTPAAASNAPAANYPLPVYDVPTKDKVTRNVETVTAVVNAVTPLLEQWAAERQQKYEAEQLRVQAIEEQSTETRGRKLNLVMARKSLLQGMANGKLPLSSQLSDTDKLYFFGFSYDAASIVTEKASLSVSEIFMIPRYTDGSWPFAKTIKDKIGKVSKSSNPQFSGYYTSPTEAKLNYDKFLDKCSTLGLNVIPFSYNQKNNEGTNNDDFWGNEGEPAKASPQKTSTDDEFWDEPASKKTTQKVKPTVKKAGSKK